MPSPRGKDFTRKGDYTISKCDKRKKRIAACKTLGAEGASGPSDKMTG